MGVYTKTIVAFLATVLGFIAPALEGGVTATEWVNVAILATGSAAVFAGPNVPGAQYTKAILAVLTAVLTVLASVIIGGITTAEWYQIGAALLGALSVYGLRNKQRVTTR